MATINVKVDVSKLRHAFRKKIQGETAVKECICIPIDQFYQGKDGALYLNLVGYDANGKWGKLYSLKQSLLLEEYKKLTEEQKRAMPFVGDITEKQGGQPQAQPQSQPQSYGSTDGDLPF